MPVIQLELDSTGAISSLQKFDRAVDATEKNTETAFSKMRGAVNRAGPAITASLAVAGAAIAAFSLKAATMASSMAETQGVFDEAFKGMTATAEQWATELGESYHLSELVAKQSLNTFQLVLSGMGVATKKAGEMSNALVRVGADLGAAFDAETADVVRDIRSALSGSTEAMDKYGVVVRSAEIAQKALSMKLAGTKAELTQAHKAQATYALILEKSAIVMGTTAREAKGYAGQLKEAKKNIGDLTVAIGQRLIPAFTEVLTLFNEWISTGDRMNTIVDYTIEAVRFLVNGFFGLELVLKSVVVIISDLTNKLIQLATPMKWVLDAFMAVNFIDANPIAELQQAVEDFALSARENVGTTIEKIEAFNLSMDRAKTKTEEVTEAVEKQAVVATPAIEQVTAEVKEALIPAEVQLKEEVEKVTAATTASTAALQGQAAAATQVAAATAAISQAEARSPGNDKRKISMGSAPAMSQEEMDYFVRMTPTGRGDHYWDKGNPMGPMGGGNGYHDNLDKIHSEKEQAWGHIQAARESGNAPGSVGAITNYFNQSLSRSDITSIISEMQRTSERT